MFLCVVGFPLIFPCVATEPDFSEAGELKGKPVSAPPGSSFSFLTAALHSPPSDRRCSVFCSKDSSPRTAKAYKHGILSKEKDRLRRTPSMGQLDPSVSKRRSRPSSNYGRVSLCQEGSQVGRFRVVATKQQNKTELPAQKGRFRIVSQGKRTPVKPKSPKKRHHQHLRKKVNAESKSGALNGWS